MKMLSITVWISITKSCSYLGMHVCWTCHQMNKTPNLQSCTEWKVVRVGQGFWVYGIQGHFKSGIQYFYAEKVLSILLFLNFRYKVYSLISFNFFIRDCLLVFRMISREILGILGIFFQVYWYTTTPPGRPWVVCCGWQKRTFNRVKSISTSVSKVVHILGAISSYHYRWIFALFHGQFSRHLYKLNRACAPSFVKNCLSKLL